MVNIVTSRTRERAGVPQTLKTFNRSSPQADGLVAHWHFRPDQFRGTVGSGTFHYKDWAKNQDTWVNGKDIKYAPHHIDGIGALLVSDDVAWLEHDLMNTYVDDIGVYTLVMWSQPVLVGVNQITWIEADSNGLGDNNGVFEFNQMSDGHFRFTPGHNNADRIVTAAGAAVVGVPNCHVGSRDGNTWGRYWLDGELVGTNTSIDAVTNGTRALFGDAPSGSTRESDQILIAASIYNKSFKEDGQALVDHIWKRETRWDLFEPPRRNYFIPDGAPPAGDARVGMYHHRHHNRAM